MFTNASIKIKLITIISVLVLGISTFVFLFFPARQNALQEEAFLTRMGAVADMVSLGTGVGLGTDQLLVLKNVFDWAKQDSSLEYIVVLGKTGQRDCDEPYQCENPGYHGSPRCREHRITPNRTVCAPERIDHPTRSFVNGRYIARTARWFTSARSPIYVVRIGWGRASTRSFPSIASYEVSGSVEH